MHTTHEIAPTKRPAHEYDGHWAKWLDATNWWSYYEGHSYRPTYESRGAVEIVQVGTRKFALRLYGTVFADEPYTTLRDAKSDAEALLDRWEH